MADLLKARKDVNAPLVFADDVQVKLMDAIRALSEARSAMVGVHGQLGEAKLRLGIRTKMAGELEKFLLNAPQTTTMRDVG
jgi:chloramphenicol 3-O-phosphotransferase